MEARPVGGGALRIEKLDVSVFTVPLEEPESDGTLTWDHTTVVVVEPTAGGHRGLGFTYATGACATLIHDVLRELVIGTDVMDVRRTWGAMVRGIRNLGRPGICSMAIAAVDIALWDLQARVLDVPLAQLLGSVRAEIPIYGSGGFTSFDDDALREQLGVWVHDTGIPRVKMKIGTSWGSEERRDLARVELVRAVIGDCAELYVDANGAYTRKQAIRLSPRLGEMGVTWFEEPVSSDDLAGLARIAAAVTPDVAAGEYGYDLAYFARMAPVVDVLQADVSRCAGITEWLRVAALAAANGLEISGHTAQLLHLHPAAAVPNLRHLEYFADHARVDELLFDGVHHPRDGVLRIDSSRPGMGLELKRGDADRFKEG